MYENFVNVDEFINCFNHGCEIRFKYNEKEYSVSSDKGEKIVLCKFGSDRTETEYETPQMVLEHRIDGKRLGDILQDIKMRFRAFYNDI